MKRLNEKQIDLRVKTSIKQSLDANIYNADGWSNLLTGLGIEGIDKRSSTFFSANTSLSEPELNAIWRGDGMGRRIIECLEDDMFRIPFTITGDTDNAILKAINSHNGYTKVKEAARWALLHGGSIAVLGINDGGFYWDPVNESRIQSIDYVHVFERWRLTWDHSDLYSDIGNPRFGTPEFYTVMPANPIAITQKELMSQQNGMSRNAYGGVFRVHESRVLRFDGSSMTDIERTRNNGWYDSYLQRGFERIKGLGESYAGLEQIVQEFILGVMKIENFAGLIANNKESALINRLHVLDRTKGILNTMMIDVKEEFSRLSATVTGLPDII